MNWLDKCDIAAEFKVSEATIDRWRKKGLPCIKIGGYVKFVLDDVLEWLKTDGNEEEK